MLVSILIPLNTSHIVAEKVKSLLFVMFNYEMEYRDFNYEMLLYPSSDPGLPAGFATDQCFVRYEQQTPTLDAKWLRLARMVQNILIPGSYTVDQLRIPQGQLN